QHLHQAEHAFTENFRYTSDRFRGQLAFVDYTQTTAALGNEHVAIGQEGEAPGMVEATSHDGYFNFCLEGLERPRTFAERRRAKLSGSSRGERHQRRCQ